MRLSVCEDVATPHTSKHKPQLLCCVPVPKAWQVRTQLVRASDLPSPAPPGHLLRQFGQSDRDQIDAAHSQPTVPQVLNLLNGFLEQYVLQNSDAVVMEALEQEATPSAKVELAYMSLLSRRPTLHERALWDGLLKEEGEAACKDLVWTLANTHEFRFVQ